MMSLLELESADALSAFLSTNANVVVCFSATWCGPCTKSKPMLIAMADEFAAAVDMDVKFGIAYEHLVGNECVKQHGVRAFPTYVLKTNFGKVDGGKVEGADLNKVRALIQQAGCQKDFGGTGNTIGGGEQTDLSGLTKEQQRELRLKRLTNTASSGAAAAAVTTKTETEATAQDVEMDVSMEDVEDQIPESSSATSSSMVDPTLNLNKEHLTQLTEGMGFTLIRAQKGLLYGANQSLEGAIDWIANHQDDEDIDDPVPPQNKNDTNKVAMSYRCKATGKLFANMAQLELHAHKTGHSDFEESTEVMVPLTPEERAKKMAEIKTLLANKKAEREEQEKKDNVAREKQRRSMGQQMIKTREQMDRDKRKRDAQLLKRQKNAEKQERERIRAELAKDKLERRANKGKLMGRLGVEGYNPSAIQYDNAEENDNTDDNHNAESTLKKKKTSSLTSIDSCIAKVAAYRAGGDGGKCLKILNAYVTNVVDKEDVKFRTINMKNKVYLAKVKPFLGAKALLLAVGFQPNDDASAMVLSDDHVDRPLLETTKVKLAAALAKY